MHELPLVFFTLFGQLGAGLVLSSSISLLFSRKSIDHLVIEKINLAALLFMAMAMIFASFHLGQPLRAFNVIFGIGRSPMSNEIFTFGLLFGVTFISVLLSYFSHPDKGNKFVLLKKLCQQLKNISYFSKLLAAILLILSLFFVWTVVLVYMLPTVKTWDTLYTPLQMYTTTFALGGIAASLFGLRYIGNLLFILGASLILLLKIPYFNLMHSISAELASEQISWNIAQSALIAAALILVVAHAVRVKKNGATYISAFSLVIIGELCGRIAFYNLWLIAM